MEYPQTAALNIRTHITNIGKYACLAMCYAYCVGIDPEQNTEMIKTVSDAIDSGILDSECTVLDAEKYLKWLTGKRFLVTKKQINKIEDIKEYTPVKYSYNGRAHWVVVKDGKIVFNSLFNSVCVNHGKPTEARIITLR